MYTLVLGLALAPSAQAESVAKSDSSQPALDASCDCKCAYAKANCDQFKASLPAGVDPNDIGVCDPATAGAQTALDTINGCIHGAGEFGKKTVTGLLGLPSALAQIKSNSDECNKSLMAKFALLHSVYQSYSDEMLNIMLTKWTCGAIAVEAKNRAESYGKAIMAKRLAIRDELEQQGKSVDAYGEAVEKQLDAKLSGNEKKFKEAEDALHGPSHAACYTLKAKSKYVCEYLLHGATALAGVAGVSKVALAREMAAASTGMRVAASAESVSAFTAEGNKLGLAAADLAKVQKVANTEQLTQLTRTFQQIRAGETVAPAEAEAAAKVLNDAGVRGVFAFHRTSEGALDSIAESGKVLGTGVQGNRVYAFPYNPGAAASKLAMKELGDSSVIFQGEAAALFKDSSWLRPSSLVGRLKANQVTRIGRVVIDEYEKVNGAIVVKKAHVVTTTEDRISAGRTLVLDVMATSFGPGSAYIMYKQSGD